MKKQNIHFKEHILIKMEKCFQLISNYPDMLIEARKMETFRDLLEPLNPVLLSIPIEEKKISSKEIQKRFDNYFSILIDIEELIIHQEDKKEYKMPTFYFYFNDVKIYADKNPNTINKIDYYNYILKEYNQNHIILRKAIYNDFISKNFIVYKNISTKYFQAFNFLLNSGNDDYRDMLIPVFGHTFEENINYELSYLQKQLNLSKENLNLLPLSNNHSIDKLELSNNSTNFKISNPEKHEKALNYIENIKVSTNYKFDNKLTAEEIGMVLYILKKNNFIYDLNAYNLGQIGYVLTGANKDNIRKAVASNIYDELCTSYNGEKSTHHLEKIHQNILIFAKIVKDIITNVK